MKLNCDMGEGFGSCEIGQDKQIMPFIDMANIACGFHASDPHIMHHTIALAVEHKVIIGAHPGYPDLAGFGRTAMSFSATELQNIILYQIGALQALCHVHKAVVSYVKPHGALYHQMMSDLDVFTTIVKAISLVEQQPTLMIMATQHRQSYVTIANQYGVSLLFEAFCDRAYSDEGLLQSRSIKGAVYDQLTTIEKQATQLIQQQSVTTASGKILSVNADTLCVHGDSTLALASIQKIRGLLAL
ncbi:hypothetical protein AB835_12235 [Candidatus Endobugula sertula]|uniref:Lactam utilization protein LamB n=1 Tax=Candidatus Endobugula sertula TaxID=62101 RepID=A0A1D2QMK3_9GAMM|nr:hypothetical protein AB835_12235 [Candidatus Endobugula sertula]